MLVRQEVGQPGQGPLEVVLLVVFPWEALHLVQRQVWAPILVPFLA